MKYFIYPAVLLFAFVFFSCSTEKELLTDNDAVVKDNLFYFSYDGEILTAEPLLFSENTTIKNVLDTVFSRLGNFFSRSYSGEFHGNVTFELTALELIETENITYRIAVVNMVDPEKIMYNWFQGSTGGKATQERIFLNIMQPQSENFINGCIIHWNNQPVGELDHVNLQGIKNSIDYSHNAGRAVVGDR
jgi:hypothetical protein